MLKSTFLVMVVMNVAIVSSVQTSPQAKEDVGGWPLPCVFLQPECACVLNTSLTG